MVLRVPGFVFYSNSYSLCEIKQSDDSYHVLIPLQTDGYLKKCST